MAKAIACLLLVLVAGCKELESGCDCLAEGLQAAVVTPDAGADAGADAARAAEPER